MFVFKLNWNGSALIYSTYVGGNKNDWGTDIKIDSQGNVIVSGVTNSSNFPTTTGAYDEVYNGLGDAFVFKLNHNGSDLIYSTFIGGNDWDWFYANLVDLFGNTILTGGTESSDFPTTYDAYDRTYNGGGMYGDAIILMLNHNGSALLYSTFFGGNNSEMGYGITSDPMGNYYITGFTDSLNFPTTPGAYNSSFNSNASVFVSKFLFHRTFNITSLSLLNNSTPTNLIYSRFSTYTFRVNITDTESLSDLGMVRLSLDPSGLNIQLLWDRATGQFSKIFDPKNYIILEPTSNAFNDSIYKWTINFNVIFNWNYPDEIFHNVQAYATNVSFYPTWFNATDFYRVENDLMFNGKLKVEGEDNRTIIDGGLVRGDEKLNWTGLTVVYENTTDVYPPDDEVDIAIWDEAENSCSDSPPAGKNFTIQTLAAPATDLDGDTHIVNLSGIPTECDKTNVTFTIKIDGDNVTFSNPRPDTRPGRPNQHLLPWV